MKKIYSVVLVVVFMFASVGYATETTSLGFRAISSASQVTCFLSAMKNFPTKINPQIYTPDPATFRTLFLGTKGMKNYSTPLKAGYFAAKYKCYDSANNDINVKQFMNGVETYYYIANTDIVGINPK